MTTDVKSDSQKMCDVALAAIADAKGVNASLLDVRKLTDITDYMIVATGTSERHVKTIAERVLEQMQHAGWNQIGMEGDAPGDRDWVLVDFVDVVVHIMRAPARERYDLESLWDESFGELLQAQRNSS